MNTKRDIKSGSSFLYRKGGTESEIIEVVMTDRVKGHHLKTAFDKAIIRFPYLKYSVIEENGSFRLITNILPFKVTRTRNLRSLGSKAVNYHLIDVTYWENRIYVAFHHGLCDGRGIRPFIETLIYNYLKIRFGAKIERPGGRFTGQHVGLSESQDPFVGEQYEVGDSQMPEVVRDGFCLPEVAGGENEGKYYVSRFVFNSYELMPYVKEAGATPAIYMALLIQKAIKKLNPDADKPIICNLASDMRDALNKSNTFKNCVSSIYLPYDERIEDMSFQEQSQTYRRVIREQKNPDYVKRNANGIKGLFDRLDSIPSFEERQKMLDFFNGMLVNTFVLSYIGQLNLKGCDDYVKSAHLYCSGSKGMIANMLSIGDSISLEIEQSFSDTKYCDELIKTFNAIGIKYKFYPLTEFETPKDSIQQSYAMSSNRSRRISMAIRFLESCEDIVNRIEYLIFRRKK